MDLVFYLTKLGTTEQLAAGVGRLLTNVARRPGIPRDAALTWRNGAIITEDTTLIEPGDLPVRRR